MKQPRNSRPGSQSVTLRLTLLFAFVSIAVLLTLGLTIGALVESHFAEMDEDLLKGKIELIEHSLSPNPNTANPEELRRKLDTAFMGHHGLAFAIWRSDGSLLYSSPEENLPERLKQPGSLPLQTLQKWADSQGHLYRGLARKLSGNTPQTQGLIATVSTELEVHEHFMRSFNATLWIAVTIAALISGLLGWFAARRGLAPLRDIARDAAEITADRLNKRLPVESIPTELAEVARTLNDMLARLETSFRRLSDFSANLAHELRTPLSNLLTQTQVTLTRPRTTDAYRDILASNAEELEHLSRIVTDMLFLAQADNDLVIPNLTQVDLRAEAESLTEFYGPLAEENGVTLTVTGQATVPGDRLMLKRALANLLSNALRHTPQGGQIEIHLQQTGPDPSLPETPNSPPSPAPPRAPGHATIRLSNTGSPIPPEQLPHLFDRFYRGEASRSKQTGMQTEGSGLGLAITRSILRAHKGEARVRTEAGRTVFELEIPKTRAEPST